MLVVSNLRWLSSALPFCSPQICEVMGYPGALAKAQQLNVQSMAVRSLAVPSRATSSANVLNDRVPSLWDITQTSPSRISWHSSSRAWKGRLCLRLLVGSYTLLIPLLPRSTWQHILSCLMHRSSLDTLCTLHQLNTQG